MSVISIFVFNVLLVSIASKILWGRVYWFAILLGTTIGIAVGLALVALS